MLILLIATSAALGGVGRYLIMIGATRVLGEHFPWGVLLVNALGSMGVGLVFGLTGSGAMESPAWSEAHALGAVGFCGGLTTFSTFSLQTLTLISQRRWKAVVANIVGSLGICLVLAGAGYLLVERWVT